MIMKARIIVPAICALLTVMTSCLKETGRDGFGKPVSFGAKASISSSTKTSYSGDLHASDMERIDWENTDIIRIISNEVSEPSEKYADYGITLESNEDKYSYATAAPYGADHGLIWGSGTHHFFALFPNPSSGNTLAISGGNGLATTTLTADQSTTQTRTGKNETYYANMDLAYMTAAVSAASGTESVELAFTPIVTTFYVTVVNTTGAAMTLRRVALSSAANAMTATWRTSFTDANVRTYTFSEGGSWVGTPTRTDANSTIYADFNGLSVAQNGKVTLALFAIPKDITQLSLSVTSDETGEITLPLKYNNNWISFTGGNKHNISNVPVPSVSYTLTVDKSALTYDYLGVAGTDQQFTVTSTKTIGANTRPAGWKTQIKNSSDQWVDLDGNCPAWLANFPLNSTGITTNSQTFEEDVTPQPVVSHEDNLKAGKVYNSSGIEYDNSTKANALDLSKYNFINHRQESMRTTANTYIVAAPGWYKIPMVYGNLIENNTTVDIACKGSRWALGHLDYFKKATDANIYLGINYPWLQSSYLDHCQIHWEKYTHWNGSSAETTGRQWSSGSDIGVVTDLELNTSEEYMYFRVDPDMIRPGNVLLATYGSDNDCCWSWQIWITDQKMDLISVGSNNVLPVNLGWIDDTEGQHYNERSEVLKFVSTEIAGLETGEMTVIQPEFDRVSTSGWQTYYQWGRKDPLTPDAMNVYNDDGTLNESIKHPSNIMYDESTSGSDEYYDWTSANYNNLWDSQNNSWATPTDQLPNHKTVYDPSPRGFSAPPDAAWDSFSTNGYEKFENGLFFYTSNSHDETIFFPASGYINYNATVISDKFDGTSGSGYYWTIRPGNNTQRRASYCLRFNRNSGGNISIVSKQFDAVSPFNTMAYRANAFSVRPVQYNVSASNSDVITGYVTKEIVFADEETAWGWTSDQNLKGPVSKDDGDVTITVKGNNTFSANDPTYSASAHTIILDSQNEITVSVPSTGQIISISISFAADDGNSANQVKALSAESSPNNGGGFTDGNGRKEKNANWNIESYTNNTFTPEANSVRFYTGTSLNGTRKITGISVTYIP